MRGRGRLGGDRRAAWARAESSRARASPAPPGARPAVFLLSPACPVAIKPQCRHRQALRLPRGSQHGHSELPRTDPEAPSGPLCPRLAGSSGRLGRRQWAPHAPPLTPPHPEAHPSERLSGLLGPLKETPVPVPQHSWGHLQRPEPPRESVPRGFQNPGSAQHSGSGRPQLGWEPVGEGRGQGAAAQGGRGRQTCPHSQRLLRVCLPCTESGSSRNRGA